jgi:hypothetical protein
MLSPCKYFQLNHNKMNCELMLTYDTPAYMFNVYKNQPSRQTGSRNLMGPIGMPYCGKRFLTRQIPTSCLPTSLVFIHI